MDKRAFEELPAAWQRERPFDPAAALRESLTRPITGETQTQGTLTRIDRDAKGITFVVQVGDRMLKLNTDRFQHANIMSFNEDAGNEIPVEYVRLKIISS